VTVVINISNSGNRDTRIEWQGNQFLVDLVKFVVGKEAEYSRVMEMFVPITRYRQFPAKSHTIRAGGTESISFGFQVPEPGLYLLSFRAVPDEKAIKEVENLGALAPVAITTSKYVWIDESPAGVAKQD
jgi:hypothetical protein